VAGTLDADGTLTKTAAGKLTLGGGTVIDLAGAVDVQAGDLEVQDPLWMGGPTLTSTGNQAYQSTVRLGNDVVSTSANGAVVFSGFVDALDDAGAGTSAHALTVRTPNGDTTFVAEVGGGSGNQAGADDDGLEVVTTDDAGVGGSLFVGADMTAAGGTLTFNDPVVLTANATLTDSGGTGITFNNTVDGDGGAWALNVVTTGGGDTTFNDLVGNTQPFTSLTTDTPGNTDGKTIFNKAGTVANPTVETNGGQTYHDKVELQQKTVLWATNANVTFNDTVNGGQNFVVNAGAGNIVFDADVGDTTPLTTVSVTSDDTVDPMPAGATNLTLHNVTTTGNQVYSVGGDIELQSQDYDAGGKIEFNTNRAAPPEVATIYRRNGDVDIDAGGDFVMHQNDKMTVLGNLDITAGGNAFLGDLSAMNKLTVAPVGAINVVARGFGQVRSATGALGSEDTDFARPDWVANIIDFNKLVTGNGTPAAVDVNGSSVATLPDMHEYPGTLDATTMLWGGIVLDMMAEGLTLTNPADTLAAAAKTLELPEPGEASPSSAGRQLLARLDLQPRDLSPEEAISLLLAGFLDDYGYNWGQQRVYVAPVRFPQSAVAQLLDAYNRVFGENRAPQLSKSLADPWTAFLEQNPSVRDAAEQVRQFEAFLLANRDQYAQALTTLDQLGTLLDLIRLLGVTQREYNRAAQALVGGVTQGVPQMTATRCMLLIERMSGKPQPATVQANAAP